MLKALKALAYAAVGCALVLSQEALADTACTFSVDKVTMSPDGTLGANLTTSGVSRYWVLCSLNATWSNINGGGLTINPTSCQALHTDLMAARLAGRKVSLTWSSVSACTDPALPAAGVPNPYPYAISY